MPHTLDVKCSRCEQRAYFEFAELVRIKEKRTFSISRIVTSSNIYFAKTIVGTDGKVHCFSLGYTEARSIRFENYQMAMCLPIGRILNTFTDALT